MTLSQYRVATVLIGGLVSSLPSQAEQLWSTFSLSYLKGGHYQVGDSHRQVLTVEHASTHSWGDNFFFLDHTASDNEVKNYFELSPRLSFSKLSGKPLQAGFLQDIFLATTWEGGNFDNYLVGLGVSLAVPKFQYFKLNVYHANNELWDDDQQLTLTWGLPFSVFGMTCLYDGFIDYSTKSDTNAAEMNFTSQLKWDIGPYFDSKTPFYVGMEYNYWNNKYGIDGVDERNPNVLIKWHF